MGLDNPWRRVSFSVSAVANLVTARRYATRLRLCPLSQSLSPLMTRPHGQRSGKKVGAKRHTGRRRRNVAQVATRSTSLNTLHEQLYAITSSSDNRLIVLSEHVDGATRPLRPLLDSGATNNFVRVECLKIPSSRMRVCESSGMVIVKYVNGKPRTHRQRSVVFPYQFEGFASCVELYVTDLSGSFDCIFGMPWLARHRLDIDWLKCTVKFRDIEVNAVLAVLTDPTSTWQHVAIVISYICDL
uniref:Polyprotein n=1 Tax=Peronospora matthiolae TaxID=2874970 RepID=A0AAV1T7U0_9STRA